ncbi:MAG TPA: 23S rRNA (pseudouridine(1915)-N(3))-methyltransferase RlmH [Candidatus Polarisedimenticolaceae bacterium]|nr:23S rRNA (pseudouridine(1915)-N(3))-methyltransferase RlmH [Candidatus Polarisedimenticolaceae bacterium]
MRLIVLSVGQPPRGPAAELVEDYVSRIRRFGISLDLRFVKEVRPSGRFTDAHRREREARALTEALAEDANRIALAPGPATTTSEQLARKLERWASPLAAFVIGGPTGLDPAFVRASEATLSLSAMTLPHELARVVLVEQLYRAVTILRHVPYHK